MLKLEIRHNSVAAIAHCLLWFGIGIDLKRLQLKIPQEHILDV